VSRIQFAHFWFLASNTWWFIPFFTDPEIGTRAYFTPDHLNKCHPKLVMSYLSTFRSNRQDSSTGRALVVVVIGSGFVSRFRGRLLCVLYPSYPFHGLGVQYTFYLRHVRPENRYVKFLATLFDIRSSEYISLDLLRK